MAVKVHTCKFMWFPWGHACRRVTDALDEKGIAYEVVKGPTSKGARERVRELTGQTAYPAIEFEDGSAYREESKDMAATIRAGRLDEKRRPAAAS